MPSYRILPVAVLPRLIGGRDARAALRRASAAFRPVIKASERA